MVLGLWHRGLVLDSTRLRRPEHWRVSSSNMCKCLTDELILIVTLGVAKIISYRLIIGQVTM